MSQTIKPISVTPAQAQVLVQDCMNVGLVPLLKGSPGTSKSSIMSRIAKERNLKLIDIRLAQIDEVELNGFPDLSGEKATYKQFDIFPTEGDQLPVKFEKDSIIAQDDKGNNIFATDTIYYDGWLLFFDELTSADKTKQGAAYKIILDRMVGQQKLHPCALVTAAGNLLTDKAVVNNMSTAMQSRLIHINMGVDANNWIEWAIGAGIDNRVISFIEWQKDKIHVFNPNHQEDTFACQRTWEFVSKLIKPMKEVTHDKLPLLVGSVSQGPAREFLSFCQLSAGLVPFATIMKDPITAKIPSDIGALYATVGMLASEMDNTNAVTVMEYLTRLPSEFQLCTIKRVFANNRKIIIVPEVRAWLQKNAKEWLN